MYVLIEHETSSDEQNTDTDYTEFFGVQDFGVNNDGSTTLFWPYFAATSGFESTIDGRVISAMEESTCDLETIVDFMDLGYRDGRTVVVPSSDLPVIRQALDHVPEERLEEITVFWPDEDVNDDVYDEIFMVKNVE